MRTEWVPPTWGTVSGLPAASHSRPRSSEKGVTSPSFWMTVTCWFAASHRSVLESRCTAYGSAGSPTIMIDDCRVSACHHFGGAAGCTGCGGAGNNTTASTITAPMIANGANRRTNNFRAGLSRGKKTIRARSLSIRSGSTSGVGGLAWARSFRMSSTTPSHCRISESRAQPANAAEPDAAARRTSPSCTRAPARPQPPPTRATR